MGKPVCVIVGVGQGNGAALAYKYHEEGHQIALLARTENYLKTLTEALSDTRDYILDVTDEQQVKEVFAKITQDMGEISTLIFNADVGGFKNIEDTTLDEFDAAWEVNTRGCFIVSQIVIASMLKNKQGNIAIIGATAAWRGSANGVALGAAKAGQRSLAQSMARYLGPKGIHVSYFVIDGVIDLPRTRKMFTDKADDSFIDPQYIADSVYFVTQQPQSAWTFELDLRPNVENW